jgi:phospholipase/carboxylesterase
MSLQVLEAQTGENPVATVLILHGLGADGRDFLPVAEQLDLSSVGPVRFIFPNAPVMPVTINGGYLMPAWYDILGADLTQRQDEAGLRHSQLAIDALIEREKSRGIASHRIVLAGFSQGCAMTLMTGLRHCDRLAGLLCMSGYLPLADKTAAERSSANQCGALCRARSHSPASGDRGGSCCPSNRRGNHPGPESRWPPAER